MGEEAVRDAYNQYLSDEAGLTKAEACDALISIGHNPTQLDIATFWKEKEKSDSDRVTEDELIELNTKLGDPETVMRKAFKLFDKNGDNKISKEELKAILKSSDVFGSGVGDDDNDDFIEQTLKLGDTDRDGYLDIDELVKMIQSGGAMEFVGEKVE